MHQSNQIWHLVSPWHHPCCCIIEQCSGPVNTRWSYNVIFLRWLRWYYHLNHHENVILYDHLKWTMNIWNGHCHHLSHKNPHIHRNLGLFSIDRRLYSVQISTAVHTIIDQLHFKMVTFILIFIFFIWESSNCIVIVIIMGDALLSWESKGSL